MAENSNNDVKSSENNTLSINDTQSINNNQSINTSNITDISGENRSKRQKTNELIKKEDYTCFICQEIVGSAVRVISECACHVIGCHDCVVEYFKTNTKCPHCQKEIKYDKKYHNLSNIELNILDECFGNIKCKNCNYTANRIQYKNIHLHWCPNSIFNCQKCDFIGLRKYHPRFICIICNTQSCDFNHRCTDSKKLEILTKIYEDKSNFCVICNKSPSVGSKHFELTCECGKLSCSEEIREHIKICKKSIVYGRNTLLVLDRVIITQKNTIKCHLCNQQYKPLYQFYTKMDGFSEIKYHNMTCPAINK